MPTREFDLLVVGGGPAGLSAAINGASEGLKVGLLDSGPELGGQARSSSAIENYPGFPEPITGGDLIGRFLRQAAKFKTDILCPQRAFTLKQDGPRRIVTSDDDQQYAARAVILSIGLSYRRLGAGGLGQFMGRGVLYGAPTNDPAGYGDCTICIVGGANSAGQAAMHFAKNPKAKIKILVRKKIEDQMSTYLLDRIRAANNIEVVEGVEVDEVCGVDKLQEITLKSSGGSPSRVQADHLFIFIGAQPKTMWLNGSVSMDDKKFVLTDTSLMKGSADEWLWKQNKRSPLFLETSMPGVFACGDVRLGSTKRVAAAIGEGSTALAMCHTFLGLEE